MQYQIRLAIANDRAIMEALLAVAREGRTHIATYGAADMPELSPHQAWRYKLRGIISDLMYDELVGSSQETPDSLRYEILRSAWSDMDWQIIADELVEQLDEADPELSPSQITPL